MTEPFTIGCRDECGTRVELPPGQLEPPGWTWLEIQKRWRCPNCARTLAAMNERKPDDSA